MRVVSLLSSATETACALGMADALVGISHECDHPPEVLDRPRVSATRVDPARTSADIDAQVRGLLSGALSVYDIDEALLGRLAPDVILTQDHCAVCAVTLDDVEGACRRLTARDTRVVSTNPTDLDGLRADFRAIAAALGVSERGEELVRSFDARLQAVRRRVEGRVRPRVALLEWIEPPMIAGGWMPELARVAGGQPVIVEAPGRFLTVDVEALRAADPDVVVVLPCGFDVPRTLQEMAACSLADAFAALRACRQGRFYVTDGNALFNRPGPRIADSAEVLAHALHPEVLGPHPQLAVWQGPTR